MKTWHRGHGAATGHDRRSRSFASSPQRWPGGLPTAPVTRVAGAEHIGRLDPSRFVDVGPAMAATADAVNGRASS